MKTEIEFGKVLGKRRERTVSTPRFKVFTQQSTQQQCLRNILVGEQLVEDARTQVRAKNIAVQKAEAALRHEKRRADERNKRWWVA